jgi:hypothetical protein
MSDAHVSATRAEFVEALQAAHAARRGVTPHIEPTVRAYARALREAGASIGEVLVQVKELVRLHTGHDEPIITPKAVGWAVAGYFEGTAHRDAR